MNYTVLYKHKKLQIIFVTWTTKSKKGHGQYLSIVEDANIVLL